MRIMHIVGNRPQFIKLSPVIRQSEYRGHRNIIIHTGQHFDGNMSEVFFDEMGIPAPDDNLHISGGSHAGMTARMMVALEPVIIKHDPDLVVVYGDTNSTLAAALTAKKMGKPVAHVEAGGRTGKDYNPEEINREVVDRVSSFLFAADRSAYDNLVKEGLADRAYFTGDVMYDSFLLFKKKEKNYIIGKDIPEEYVLMTWHRAENTSDKPRMNYLLDFVGNLPLDVICPMHPRTKECLKRFGLNNKAKNIPNFKIIDPVGYIEMIKLTCNAQWILTDSGGLSKESYFAGKRCLFTVDLHVWPELMNCGWIVRLSDDMQSAIVQAQDMIYVPRVDEEFFGDGNAAGKIVDIIEKYGKH